MPNCVDAGNRIIREEPSCSSCTKKDAELTRLRLIERRGKDVIEAAVRLRESLRRCDRDGNPQIDAGALLAFDLAVSKYLEGGEPNG